MLQDILVANGLTIKEAAVYIAALQLDQAPATTIARHASEKRLTVYASLQSLIAKGCATEIVRNNTKYYSVIPPDQLFRLKQRAAQDRLAQFEDALPAFLSLAEGFGAKPQVYMYDGLAGLKTMYEESLDSPYMCAILGKEKMASTFATYLYEDYVPRRIAKNIPTRLIYARDSANSIDNFVAENHPDEHNRQIAVINDPIFQINNSIYFHSENKVSIAMFSAHDMSGLTIESQNVHDSLQSIFELLWKTYFTL